MDFMPEFLYILSNDPVAPVKNFIENYKKAESDYINLKKYLDKKIACMPSFDEKENEFKKMNIDHIKEHNETKKYNFVHVYKKTTEKNGIAKYRHHNMIFTKYKKVIKKAISK